MADAKVFRMDGSLTLEDVARALEDFLSTQKHLETEGVTQRRAAPQLAQNFASAVDGAAPHTGQALAAGRPQSGQNRAPSGRAAPQPAQQGPSLGGRGPRSGGFSEHAEAPGDRGGQPVRNQLLYPGPAAGELEEIRGHGQGHPGASERVRRHAHCGSGRRPLGNVFTAAQARTQRRAAPQLAQNFASAVDHYQFL